MTVGLIYAEDNADELIAIISSNKHYTQEAMKEAFMEALANTHANYQDLVDQSNPEHPNFCEDPEDRYAYESFDEEVELEEQCAELGLKYIPSWHVIDPHSKTK